MASKGPSQDAALFCIPACQQRQCNQRKACMLASALPGCAASVISSYWMQQGCLTTLSRLRPAHDPAATLVYAGAPTCSWKEPGVHRSPFMAAWQVLRRPVTELGLASR
jgi:hypothetical protein